MVNLSVFYHLGPFGTPETLYRCLEMAKKLYSSIVLCMRKVLVRSVLVLCINVVIAPKKVTEKVKKWEKIATLWLFLSHMGCHMAPRLQKHEYLLATKFWSDFEHFRMSGSIITRELFLSLTSPLKQTSSFGSNTTNSSATEINLELFWQKDLLKI